MLRVLKPGALGLVLEFSKPKHFPIKQVFGLYFKYIMPTVGKWVSKDPSAYTYLPESVQAFPEGEGFLDQMRKRDMKTFRRSLTGGHRHHLHRTKASVMILRVLPSTLTSDTVWAPPSKSVMQRVSRWPPWQTVAP